MAAVVGPPRQAPRPLIASLATPAAPTPVYPLRVLGTNCLLLFPLGARRT